MTAVFGTNHIIKYADDTTVGRLLQGGGGAFHVGVQQRLQEKQLTFTPL